MPQTLQVVTQSADNSAAMADHLDVVIVGAGISGIGAAYHLQKLCPQRSYTILEGRDAIGGTWDLFRYPGIRSDSDMHTFGYGFKPWSDPQAIADGPSILRYLRETVDTHGLERHIRFGHKVVRAAWSSDAARWTLDVARTGSDEMIQITANFLFCCSGYYRHDQGFTPDFAGTEKYQGKIVHPQHWDPTLDCTGKRVVVIGSGATAVTLVPELAKTAAEVVMLQRSPSYILSTPGRDVWEARLGRWLPRRLVYTLIRWRNVSLSLLLFGLSRRAPQLMKRLLVGRVRKELGPDYDVDTHFTPRYNPWDQRLCLVPDSDLFASIRSGRTTVVTDTIDRFTETGILLTSGRELQTDVVVTATGLQLVFLGGIELWVDGSLVRPNTLKFYRGAMFGDVPNLALVAGYTNASWTLRADLTAKYVCRLLNHMQRTRQRVCVPRRDGSQMEDIPLADFTSGYIQRSLKDLPTQGNRAPWRLYQNYIQDRIML